jgi:hypothetical protein
MGTFHCEAPSGIIRIADRCAEASVSIQALSWVLEHSESRLGPRHVLISIANHASREGDNAFPSIRTIAHEARLSLREVNYALPVLIKSGELAMERGAGPGGTNLYSLPRMGGANFAGGVQTGVQNPARNKEEQKQPESKPPNPPFSKGGLSSRDRRNIAKELDRIAAASVGVYVPDPVARWEEMVQCVAARLVLPLLEVREAIRQSLETERKPPQRAATA